MFNVFSPPRGKTSRSKGKGRADPAEHYTPSGSSKVASTSGSTPLPKLTSFAAALAKKGVTVESALEKVDKASPSEQQYLADLNGYRVS